MYDVFIEVLDVAAPAVLASIGPMRPSQARTEYPVGYFKGTRLGIRFGETAEGHSLVHVGAVRLQAEK
jgi:hypothetical protein